MSLKTRSICAHYGNHFPLAFGLRCVGRKPGRAWPETAVEDTNLETLIEDLLDGQYSNPIRIVAFNTAEGWSRDVSEVVVGRSASKADLMPTGATADPYIRGRTKSK